MANFYFLPGPTPVPQVNNLLGVGASWTGSFRLDSISNVNVSLEVDPQDVDGNGSVDGNLDLFVYQDTNSNGNLDSKDLLIGSSTNGGNSDESLDLPSLAAGDYLLEARAISLSSGDNVNINISVTSEVADVGTLNDTQTLTGSLDSTDTSDPYRFSLGSTSNLNVALTGLSANADVQLYQDGNNNGVIDAPDTIIDSSGFDGNQDEEITRASLAAGNYLVQVSGAGGDTTYNLSLSTANPSDLLPKENEVGTLNGTQTLTGNNVGNNDPSDLYHFSVDTTGSEKFSLSLTGLSADADVRLIQDKNSNGIVDFPVDVDSRGFLSIEVLYSSTLGSTTSELIDASLEQGDYFVQVYQFSGDTNYTLGLSTNNPSNLLSTEVELGTLNGTQTLFDSVGSTDPSDVYHFSVGTAGNFDLSLTGLSADADVRLIRDTNSNGIVDSSEFLSTEVLYSSTLGSTTSELIDYAFLNQGDYFVQVYQHSGDTNYTLDLTV